MPRKRELTWQAGSGDRPGRWRKKYRGQVFYVGTGSSKSDHASYQKALTNWEEEKKRVDAQLAGKPKPHQAEYEEAIGDWEKVLRWSQSHGDQATADRARGKIDELLARLEQSSPPPLGYGDRFWDSFEIPNEMHESLRAITESRAIAVGIAPTGYNVLWIEGVALAPDQLDFRFAAADGRTRSDNNGGMFLHGVNVGLEARF